MSSAAAQSASARFTLREVIQSINAYRALSTPPEGFGQRKILDGMNFWAPLFKRFFIECADDDNRDDLLYFVPFPRGAAGSPSSPSNSEAKSKPAAAATAAGAQPGGAPSGADKDDIFGSTSDSAPVAPKQVQEQEASSPSSASTAADRNNVFFVRRRTSKDLPSTDNDTSINWEATMYLNLILHHFEYHLIVSTHRSSDYAHIKRITQKVDASPSAHRMDTKGMKTILTYPKIFFTIENFDELFEEMTVDAGQSLVVKLNCSVINNAHSIQSPAQQASAASDTKSDAVAAPSEQSQSQQAVKPRRRSVIAASCTIFGGMVEYSQLNKAFFSARKRNTSYLQIRGPAKTKKEFLMLRGPKGKGKSQVAISLFDGDSSQQQQQQPPQQASPPVQQPIAVPVGAGAQSPKPQSAPAAAAGTAPAPAATPAPTEAKAESLPAAAAAAAPEAAKQSSAGKAPQAGESAPSESKDAKAAPAAGSSNDKPESSAGASAPAAGASSGPPALNRPGSASIKPLSSASPSAPPPSEAPPSASAGAGAGAGPASGAGAAGGSDTWVCPACTFQNSPRNFCEMCNGKRPGLASRASVSGSGGAAPAAASTSQSASQLASKLKAGFSSWWKGATSSSPAPAAAGAGAGAGAQAPAAASASGSSDKWGLSSMLSAVVGGGSKKPEPEPRLNALLTYVYIDWHDIVELVLPHCVPAKEQKKPAAPAPAAAAATPAATASDSAPAAAAPAPASSASAAPAAATAPSTASSSAAAAAPASSS